MQIDEVVAFRTYDSDMVASGEPYWTPHGAVRDPEVELGQPARSSIELRATKLRISSGEQVIVPNTLVFGGIVINNSYYAERRSTINVSLPIEAFDKQETLDQILKALKETDTVAEVPAPIVVVSNYTAEHVVLLVHFWIRKGKFASISDVMYTLRKALPKADLSYVDSTVEIA